MIEHGSTEWNAARLGIPTGSEIHKIMPSTEPIAVGSNEDAKPKRVSKDPDKRSETWKKYAAEKLAERILGRQTVRFVNRAMRHGTDTEPKALTAYEIRTGHIVMPAGFIRCDGWGCTPDGLIDDDGIVSIKCPETETFVYQLALDHRIKVENYWQAVAELAATGRQWVDLALYDPRIPDQEARLYIRRIPRDETAIEKLRREVGAFCDFLDEKCAMLGVEFPPKSDNIALRLMAG